MNLTLRIFFSFILCFVLQQAKAQNVVFNGKIVHKETKESISNVTITFKGNVQKQIPSDANGDFTVSLPKGTYTIVLKSINFKTLRDTLNLNQSTSRIFELQPSFKELVGVEVIGQKQKDRTAAIQSGTEQLSMTEIEKIPVFLGEKDIIKTIQLKPGVTSAGEGVAGFFVRGGSTDQNLVLLDQMQIYNAAHLLGFFSTFNADALKAVELYKGTQPSSYGGRLSSVLDVQSNSGSTDKWTFKGGVGLIASRFTLNGPLVKGKSGINFSARRTYADVFTKLSSDENIKNAILNFYDLNGNIHYEFSKTNKLSLDFYNGRDNFGVNNGFGITWGNKNVGLHWENTSTSNTKSDTYLNFNKFDYQIKIGNNDKKILVLSGIQNLHLKQEFSKQVAKNQLIKYGVDVSYLQLQPQKVDNPFSSDPPKTVYTKRGLENGLYFTDEITAVGNFNFNVGLRLSTFTVMGGQKGDIYKTYQEGKALDSVDLSQKWFGKTYLNLEPRIGINYTINPLSALKFFYSRNTQNIHILNNITASSPTDVYLLTNYQTRPEIANQFSLGYFKTLPNKKYEWSVEGFYKKFQNQIDYSALTNVNGEDFSDADLYYGVGKAFGLETYFHKKTGKFTGWISYTYSRSLRQIAQINDGKYYPARQDRPHSISLVGIYDISKRLNISATWTYLTGSPTTFPSAVYYYDNQLIKYYNSRNQDRFPDYHRMDLSINWKGKNLNKRFQSEWNVSIYNLYNRYNAYFIQLTTNDNKEPVFQQTSLFGIVPSITYNFKF